ATALAAPFLVIYLGLGLGLSGCSGEGFATCMTMGGPSALVTGAALLRLEVYGPEAHCEGSAVVGATSAPTTRDFPRGQPVQLEIPAGHHAVVLTSFSDAAGQHPLGAACSEVDYAAGAGPCLN